MGGESERPQRIEQRITAMESILKEIKDQVDNLSKKGITIEKKITEQGVKINKIEEICVGCKALKSEIDNIKVSNIQLKKRVNEMERKIEQEEINKKRNTIEIYGIPEKDKEDINNIVKRLADHAKVNLKKEDIEKCYRPRKGINGREKPIVVSFKEKDTRDKIIKAMKVSKPRLGNINMEPENKMVFINEALIPERKRLLFQAKQEARVRNWYRVWTYAGAIFVLIEEKGKNIKIESEQELEILIK